MVAGDSLQQGDHSILSAVMQYLLDSDLTHPNIANYLVGVRAYFLVYGYVRVSCGITSLGKMSTWIVPLSMQVK